MIFVFAIFAMFASVPFQRSVVCPKRNRVLPRAKQLICTAKPQRDVHFYSVIVELKKGFEHFKQAYTVNRHNIDNYKADRIDLKRLSSTFDIKSSNDDIRMSIKDSMDFYTSFSMRKREFIVQVMNQDFKSFLKSKATDFYQNEADFMEYIYILIDYIILK